MSRQHRPHRLIRRSASLVILASLGLVSAQVAASGAPPGASDRLTATADQPGKVQVVHVKAATKAQRNKVAALPLDVTEHGDSSGLEVVLYGDRDAQVLRDAGLTWSVEIADLEETVEANAAKDARYAAATAESPLPSGRTEYRNLDDYNNEMASLASRYRTLVKPLTLKNSSVEGRPVRGIEITNDAARVNDGKPVFLMMGAHHAREWPSAEHSMEFAYDLLTSTDARTRAILEQVRVIVVPVVNVDGFVISRAATPIGNFGLFDYEMKRKNCSISVNTPANFTTGTCADNPAGRLRGTDPNRNYPGFWGGPGASTNWSSDTYRGDAPGDTPEVDNIRDLISKRQVTNLISNHTYSNLVLRPPSIASTGLAPDEPVLKALGKTMTDANGYANWAAYQLYDTSGSVEDWSYWNTAGLGYTFEIGPSEFHPPYETGVVAEYLGLEPAAGAGRGGNREAYYAMAEATANPANHSTITGTAGANRTLTVSKTFTSMTSPVIQAGGGVGDPIQYTDTLTSSLDSKGGAFSWAVNPSTRPVVAGRFGRDPLAPTQPSVTLSNPAGIPGTLGTEVATFDITGLPTYDNARAAVEISWPSNAADWDVFVLNSDGVEVASAASLDNPEVATLIDPVPGTYTVVVQNYSGGTVDNDWSGQVRFLPPTPATDTGVKEAWSLTCTNNQGKIQSTRTLIVDRGQSVDVGNACAKAPKP